MGLSGQNHPPTALTRVRNPEPIEYEAGWLTQAVWTICRKLSCPCRDLNPEPSNPERIRYTD
jgi:hypothetical protein